MGLGAAGTGSEVGFTEMNVSSPKGKSSEGKAQPSGNVCGGQPARGRQTPLPGEPTGRETRAANDTHALQSGSGASLPHEPPPLTRPHRPAILLSENQFPGFNPD